MRTLRSLQRSRWRSWLGAAALGALLASGPPGCAGLIKAAGKGGAKTTQKGARRGCSGLAVSKASRKGWRATEGASNTAVLVSDDGLELSFALHRSSGVVEPIDDLAVLAGSDEAVDVFLDTPLLARVTDIESTVGQRLYWIGRDRVARLVRLGSDGVTHVAAATTRDGRPRLWVRAAEELLDLVLTVSDEPAWFDQIVVIDPRCAEVPGARVAGGSAEALAATEGLVLLIAAGQLEPTTVEIARIEGVDLLAIAEQPVCGPDGTLVGDAEALLRDASRARTWGEVWSVGATSTHPAIVTDVTQNGDWLAIVSPSRTASIYVYEPSIPPVLLVAIAGGSGGLLFALPLVWWRLRD